MSEDAGEAWAKIKDDALRLLSFRPRSVAELRQRLKLKKHSDVLVDKAITFMGEHGLLNDERFAKMFVSSRTQGRPVGKIKIRQDLTQKGISKSLIDEALSSIDATSEKESALGLARKKMAIMQDVPQIKQKMRLLGHLRRRGYSSEAVNFALNNCFKNIEDLE